MTRFARDADASSPSCHRRSYLNGADGKLLRNCSETMEKIERQRDEGAKRPRALAKSSEA
ncbi:hypothetical protein HGO21_00375 [Acinetobacter sp. CUI P1]|nr:hypothetical protein [Acinetobacter sp. CUI P1]